MKSTIDQLFQDFSTVKRPKQVKGCDCPFCLTSEEITALLDVNQKSLCTDELYSYVDNVLVTIGSPEDFVFLLPAILKCWSVELYASQDSAYNQRLHSALLRDNFLHGWLAAKLRLSVLEFMHVELLKRIGIESSLLLVGKTPTHYWFGDFASWGVLSDRVSTLWREWWSMPSEGHAIAAVQYASCLICDGTQNPVFAPWSADKGGGAPCLWEYESFSFDECWMKHNIEFLEKELSVEYLQNKLAQANQAIENNRKKDIVVKVQKVLERESQRAESRIKELLEMLSRRSAPGGPYRWTY